jgi:hypothetical protein
MDHAALAAAVLDDGGGAPAWLVAVILVALSSGIGWWFTRLSRSGSGPRTSRAQRSKKYRALTEDHAVAATLAAAAAPVDPLTDRVVQPVVAAVPEVSEDGRTLAQRLDDLDNALHTGKLSTDEHRVLRAALLEGFPGGWTRPVAPPTE